MKKFLLTVALALVPLATLASTMIGNPSTSVVLVDGDGVYVQKVTAYRCTTGSQIIPVDATLDEWEEAEIEFTSADFCDVIVKVRWTPTEELTSVAVNGYDTLSIDSEGAAFTIDLDETARTATFN